ncbi:hypothetical protein Q8W71_10205 [Methylobacterium sp. NEAU 140]|uniref:hypothetical protein n=1 Tax=Methylobacterium sp. NEAU 140 TaxID=3064945 RepID=UPI002736F580|nr:hypothetical protein [Methylobacterium sp. NEAU 140]MDP4022996.1 hypothetical protein [Methylobacterium sp. NEAU 140]
MSGCCTLWRRFATILQVVALVGMAFVTGAHSHRGEVTAGHVRSATVDLPAQAVERVLQASPSDDAHESAGPTAGLDCCQHHTMRLSGESAPTVTRTLGRILAGIRAVTFDSVPPESQAEPPRPFA